MANQYHVIKINDVTFIEVHDEVVNGEPATRLAVQIGGHGSSLRLDKATTIELITALAETARAEQDIINIYSETPAESAFDQQMNSNAVNPR